MKVPKATLWHSSHDMIVLPLDHPHVKLMTIFTAKNICKQSISYNENIPDAVGDII